MHQRVRGRQRDVRLLVGFDAGFPRIGIDWTRHRSTVLIKRLISYNGCMH